MINITIPISTVGETANTWEPLPKTCICWSLPVEACRAIWRLRSFSSHYSLRDQSKRVTFKHCLWFCKGLVGADLFALLIFFSGRLFFGGSWENLVEYVTTGLWKGKNFCYNYKLTVGASDTLFDPQRCWNNQDETIDYTDCNIAPSCELHWNWNRKA